MAAALGRADVPFFVVPTYIGETYRIGVLDPHRRRALDAINGAANGGWKVKALGRAKPVAVPIDEADMVAVFRPQTWERSTFRLRADAGVVVEFWHEMRLGWESPSRNPVACIVTPSQQGVMTTSVGGASYPTLAGLAAEPWDEITDPIDVVYTWVDGSDPEWAARRDETLRAVGGSAAVRPESRDEIRFADHGELRYSLRSVEQFLPWARNIWLVTAGQRPDWLVADHPRLRLVDHADILEPAALPTFNSLAIETGLHRIHGLSARFVYFNDDVFAGRSLTPRDFFLAAGGSKFFLQTRATFDPAPLGADDPPVSASNKRVRDLLERDFGRRISRLPAHTPHPLQRDLLAELEQCYPEEIQRTRRSQFRGPDNIPMVVALHHYYGYFTGRTQPGTVRYRGVPLGGELARNLDVVARKRPETFCLNDTVIGAPDAEEKARLVRRFLRRYFPEPSTFERS